MIESEIEFHSQAGQDIFALKATEEKRDGVFVELGSWKAIEGNNTYLLENSYNWSGLMVEMTNDHEDEYKNERPRSKYIISDAQLVDYASVFKELEFPPLIDYLSLDLEPSNGSTLVTIDKLEREVMGNHIFSVVTFEHDIYCCGNFECTRDVSRKIFERNGYLRMFSDVRLQNPFEDWYVHPETVSSEFIDKYKTEESLEWSEIIKGWFDVPLRQKWSGRRY
jgi:hypothetical protein